MGKYIILIPTALDVLKEIYAKQYNFMGSLKDYVEEQFIYNGIGLLYKEQDNGAIKFFGKEISIICVDADEVNSLKVISVKKTNKFEYLYAIEKGFLIKGEWRFISIDEANDLDKKDDFDLENHMEFIEIEMDSHRKKNLNIKDIIEFEKYENYWHTLDLAQKYEENNINDSKKASIVEYENINVEPDKYMAIIKIKDTDYNYRNDDRILLVKKNYWNKHYELNNDHINKISGLELGSIERYDNKNNIIKIKCNLEELKILMKDKEYKNDGFLWVDDIGSKSKLRREKQALKKLFNGETANEYLKEFIPNIQSLKPILDSEIEELFFSESYKKLEGSQVEAVRNALGCSDIYLIQGPPGTGKTTVICEIIKYLVKENKKVLLSSQTNLAVDNVLQRIGNEKNVRAIRIGRKEKFLLDSERYSLEQRVNNVQKNIMNTIKDREKEYIFLKEELEYKNLIYKSHEEMFSELTVINNVIMKYDESFKKIEELNKEIEKLENSINKLKKKISMFNKLEDDKKNRLKRINNIQKNSKYSLKENIIISQINQYLELQPQDKIDIEKYFLLLEKINESAIELKHIQNQLIEKEAEKERTIEAFKDARLSSKKGKREGNFGIENFFNENIKSNIGSYDIEFLDIDEISCQMGKLKRKFKNCVNSIHELKREAMEIKSRINSIINLNKDLWLKIYKDPNKSVKEFLDIYIRLKNFNEEFESITDLNGIELDELTNYNEYEDRVEELDYFIKQKIELEEKVFFQEKSRNEYNYKISDYKEDPNICTYLDYYSIDLEDLDIKVDEKRCYKYTLEYKKDVDKLELYEATQDLQSEWSDKLSFYQEAFEDIYINISNLICATCLGISSTNNNHFLDTDFDYVIVDEAARATAMELLIPIIRGKKIILVGDHKQISPQIEKSILRRLGEEESIDEEEIQNIYKKSLFGIMYEDADARLKTLLDKQFRMNTDISNVVSKLFYNGAITNGNNVMYNTHGMENLLNRAFYWVDTDSDNESTEKKDENKSFYNLREIETIENILNWLDSNLKEEKEIGIISPYMAQTIRLREKLGNKYKNIFIEIDTIDAFQGREKDIIIMSLVRNNDSGRMGFITADSRINVAISRARELMFLVGNMKFIKSNKNKAGNLYNILCTVDEQNCILSNDFFN